jgi:hypothetical protein
MLYGATGMSRWLHFFLVTIALISTQECGFRAYRYAAS